MYKILSLAALAITISLAPDSGFAATPDADYQRALTYMHDRGFAIDMDTWKTNVDAPMSKVGLLSLLVKHLYPADIYGQCLEEIGSTAEVTYTLLFKDMPVKEANARMVCVGMQTGMVDGNQNGMLQPLAMLNLAQASKMLVKGYVLAPPRTKVAKGNWYDSFIYDLRNRGGIPPYLKNPGQTLTHRDIALMLYGLRAHDVRFTKPKPKPVGPSDTVLGRPRRLEQRPLRSR